jgi:membrane protein insertase Oxa1/YidC/SpoIIIJ
MSILNLLFHKPAFNALILIYNLMPVYKDMGIALIVFTVIMDLALSPLRKKVRLSEPDQEQVMIELKQAEEEFKGNYVMLKKARKEIMKKHKKTFSLRGADLIIEGIYFVTLWWVFSHSMPNRRWDLLYSWVPQPLEPVNLTFLGLFDLTIVSPMLNLISAVGLFIVLFLKTWWKPQKATREDYLLIIWAPFAAFFISSQLPAGQEFFFTILEVLTLLRLIRNKLAQVSQKLGFSGVPGAETGKGFVKTALKQIFGS